MTGGNVKGGGQRRFEDQEVEALRRLKENLLAHIEALPNKNIPNGMQEKTLPGGLTGLEQQLEYRQTREANHTQTHLNSNVPKY